MVQKTKVRETSLRESGFAKGEFGSQGHGRKLFVTRFLAAGAHHECLVLARGAFDGKHCKW